MWWNSPRTTYEIWIINETHWSFRFNWNYVKHIIRWKVSWRLSLICLIITINGWGSSQAHEARQSLRYICQQVLLFLKATNVLSTEVESQTLILLHQVRESCAVLQGIFNKDILEELCWLWHIYSWSLVQMLLLWTRYLSNLHQQWYNNVENTLQERILVMFSCHRRKCVPSHIYIILLHVPHPNIRVSWHGH